MRQKTKKLLSVVLSLSMAFSVMPLTAYAAESTSGGGTGNSVILEDVSSQTTTTPAEFDIATTTSDEVFVLTFTKPVEDATSSGTAFNLDGLDNGYYEQIKNQGIDLEISKSLIKADEPLIVDAVVAAVEFDEAAVGAIKSGTGNNITLSIKGGKAVEADYITNSAYVIDLTLTDEDDVIDFSAGNVTVTVPVADGFKPTQLLQAANSGVEVYYQPNASTAERIAGADFDGGTNAVTFTTKHFSPYNILINQGLIKDPVAIDVEAGKNVTLTVTSDAGTDADSIASYNAVSSDTDIADVFNNNNGTFTVEGKAEGSATLTISATGQNGFGNPESITVTVTVREADGKLDQSIVFTSPASYSLRVGRTFDINDYIDKAKSVIDPDANLTYSSDNESVATVDADGTVRAIARGPANIYVAASETDTHNATTSAVFALTVTRSSNGEDSSSSSSGGGGGGSSSSGYSVNVSSASNGTVSVDKDRASSGSTVTITAEPDEGYVVGSVTVTDSDGNEITVRDRGNNEYTFTMPSSRVTIEVEFVEDTTVEEPVDEITETDFSDVSSSDWFYDAVNYVFSKGIMVGVTENSFAPNSSLTRAMIVQMLYSLEGSPEVTGTAPFTDVAIGQWYTNAITWAASNNIVSGMGDGTFAPNNNITREQLAMILYNYAQLKGNAVTASGNLAAFTDGNEVSDWAETAVRWAVGEGLMSGRGNGVLDPTETTTRAEAASMFMRFMESDLA